MNLMLESTFIEFDSPDFLLFITLTYEKGAWDQSNRAAGALTAASLSSES